MHTLIREAHKEGGIIQIEASVFFLPNAPKCSSERAIRRKSELVLVAVRHVPLFKVIGIEVFETSSTKLVVGKLGNYSLG